MRDFLSFCGVGLVAIFRFNAHERKTAERVPHPPIKRLGRVFYRTAPGRFWRTNKGGKPTQRCRLLGRVRCGLAWCSVGERTSDLERVFEAAAPGVKVTLPGVMTDIARGEGGGYFF